MSDRYQVSKLKHNGLCLIDTHQEDDEQVIVTVEREVQARILAGLLNEKEDLINEKPLDLHKDFAEWDRLITSLNTDETKLIELKELYSQLEQDIINNTDFKELYGKNNETVRKNHVKNELKDMVDDINTLKLTIDNTKRRISFLKSMVAMKTELIKYGGKD